MFYGIAAHYFDTKVDGQLLAKKGNIWTKVERKKRGIKKEI